MPGLRDIKRRLQTVKNIKKITYAMKLVSTAKLKKAQSAVVSTRDYTLALGGLLGELQAQGGDAKFSHPLLEAKETVRRVAVIIIGGSRGLCGGYNTNVNKAVEAFSKEIVEAHGAVELSYYLLGKKPADYFRRMKRAARKAYEALPEDPYLWPLEEVARELEGYFLDGTYDEVYIIYTKFRSAISMRAVSDRLLPLRGGDLESGGSSQVHGGDIIFEPSPQAVFNLLVPKILRVRLLQACLDAKASEHGSRMTAMDNATKNGDELVLKLSLLHNKLRQSGITGELLDIIGGANALE